MKRLVVFASGNGSNFQAIVEAMNQEGSLGNVVGCICDQQDAYVIQRANQLNVPVAVFERSMFLSKDAMEQAMVTACQMWQADWIVLAGYMRLCGSTLLSAYPRHILNIHPSLLPNYRGLGAIERALEANEAILGVTIHYVDEGMDTGEIIIQVPFAVSAMSYEKVKETMHRVEHQLYPAIISKLLLEETYETTSTD